MSSAYNPGEFASAPRPDAEPPAAPVEQPSDSGVLDQVLAQSSTPAFPVGEPLDIGDMEAMREVAQLFRGQPLTLDPITIELIHSSLRSRFGNKSSTAELHVMAKEIAMSLFDDPLSRERLETLWNQLSQD